MAHAFSRHLAATADHLAAAARDLAAAARAARRGDDEIESVVPSSSTSSPASSSNGSVPDIGDVDIGELEDDLEAILDCVSHVYDWVGLLGGIALPVPVYYGLPEETRASAGWTWILLVYAVFFSVGVTYMSTRVFRSPCCICTVLRALLLSVCLVAEMFAALRLLPATTLTLAGAGFSMVHLFAIYLGVWNMFPPLPRRRRR